MACFHVAYTSFPCGVDNAYLNHSSLVKYECLFLMQIYFSLKFNKNMACYSRPSKCYHWAQVEANIEQTYAMYKENKTTQSQEIQEKAQH